VIYRATGLYSIVFWFNHASIAIVQLTSKALLNWLGYLWQSGEQI